VCITCRGPMGDEGFWSDCLNALSGVEGNTAAGVPVGVVGLFSQENLLSSKGVSASGELD
jgi:hypothetical protein